VASPGTNRTGGTAITLLDPVLELLYNSFKWLCMHDRRTCQVKGVTGTGLSKGNQLKLGGNSGK
jgi:hypothetical protein